MNADEKATNFLRQTHYELDIIIEKVKQWRKVYVPIKCPKGDELMDGEIRRVN